MTSTVQTAPAAATKTTWKLDPAHTTVEFSAKHLMITTVKGRIADVAGTIYMDENDPKNSSVEATLNAASLDTRAWTREPGHANRPARPTPPVSRFPGCGEVSRD